MTVARLLFYPVLFGLALIGLLPGAVIIGLVALILPGLILLAAPTAALYIPIVDALVTGLVKRRPTLWLPALAALPVIALLLPMQAGRALDAEIAALTAGDIARDPGGPTRRLLLHDHSRGRGSAGGPYRDRWIYDGSSGASCDETCARLLMTRQVEAIIRPISSRRDRAPSLEGGVSGKAIVYTYEPGPICPTPERNGLQVQPDTLALIGSGHCIVAREVADAPFDAAVVTRTDSLSVGRFDAASAGVSKIERRTVWRCAGGHCAPTEVVTTVVAKRLAAPLVIGVETLWDRHMRRAFWRRPETINPLTAKAQLFRVFGFRDAPLPAVDPARTRAAAEAALAAAASDRRRLAAAEEEAIERTLKLIAEGEGAPSPEDIALLRTIALHPTADWLAYYGDVFRKHPETTVQLADTLIDGYVRILGRERPQTQNDLRRGLARALAGVPPEVFAAKGPAILAAIDRPGGLEDIGGLVERLGDLGPQALPALRKVLAVRKDAEPAALGLCRMGPPAQSLAPEIAARLLERRGDRDRYRLAAVVLARLGRPDLIRRPPAEAYERVNEAGKRYDDRWFDAVPPTITPASPREICSRETISNRQTRAPRRLASESR